MESACWKREPRKLRVFFFMHIFFVSVCTIVFFLILFFFFNFLFCVRLSGYTRCQQTKSVPEYAPVPVPVPVPLPSPPPSVILRPRRNLLQPSFLSLSRLPLTLPFFFLSILTSFSRHPSQKATIRTSLKKDCIRGIDTSPFHNSKHGHPRFLRSSDPPRSGSGLLCASVSTSFDCHQKGARSSGRVFAL